MAGNDMENRKENEKTIGAEWSDRYLKEMEKLRQEIGEKEKKGVNVNRAWRLFGIARKLDREDDVEKAFDYLEKVRGDLAWKEKLYGWSTNRWVVYSAYAVPFIMVLPAIIYLVIKLKYDIDIIANHPIILGIPIFILAWGYVGSAAYVLISIGQKMTKRLFNRREMLEYSYRMILGGILAGIIFYVIQLAFVSLPGTAGEEINAALETGGAPAKYRESAAKRKKLIDENDKYEEIISYFEYGYKEFYSEEYVEYYEYYEYDEYYNLNNISRMADLLLRYVEEWRALENLESKAFKDDPTYDGEIDTLKIRKARVDKNDDYILDSFKVIKNEIIADKKDKIEANIARLVEVDKYIFDTKYRLESALIEDDIEDLRLELDQLHRELRDNEWGKGDIETILEGVESGDISHGEELYRSPANLKVDLERKNKTIGSLNMKIEDIEKEKWMLEDKLEKAKKREAEKPVWESAVFIVIAFFSGYSINFVTKMFDRAMTAIISGKPGETELEGDVPPEPEAGGEDAVG